MTKWDKTILVICRIAGIIPCALLAANTVATYSAIRASPVPLDIPYRNEIYLSLGLSAVSVRSLIFDILENWLCYSGC